MNGDLTFPRANIVIAEGVSAAVRSELVNDFGVLIDRLVLIKVRDGAIRQFGAAQQRRTHESGLQTSPDNARRAAVARRRHIRRHRTGRIDRPTRRFGESNVIVLVRVVSKDQITVFYLTREGYVRIHKAGRRQLGGRVLFPDLLDVIVQLAARKPVELHAVIRRKSAGIAARRLVGDNQFIPRRGRLLERAHHLVALAAAHEAGRQRLRLFFGIVAGQRDSEGQPEHIDLRGVAAERHIRRVYLPTGFNPIEQGVVVRVLQPTCR